MHNFTKFLRKSIYNNEEVKSGMRKRSKEFDVFGIVLGMIIGLLIGFFLSGRINFSPVDDVYGGSLKEGKDNIYLLEAGRFENVSDAKALYEQLTNKGVVAVKVEERIGKKTFYCIYLNISLKKQELEQYKNTLDFGINLEVRTKYINNLTEQFNNGSIEKKFWNEVINNLFKTLTNEEIEISEEFYINPENVEVFSYFMTLNGLKNEFLKTKYRLEVYRVIMETLS